MCCNRHLYDRNINVWQRQCTHCPEGASMVPQLLRTFWQEIQKCSWVQYDLVGMVLLRGIHIPIYGVATNRIKFTKGRRQPNKPDFGQVCTGRSCHMRVYMRVLGLVQLLHETQMRSFHPSTHRLRAPASILFVVAKWSIARCTTMSNVAITRTHSKKTGSFEFTCLLMDNRQLSKQERASSTRWCCSSALR